MARIWGAGGGGAAPSRTPLLPHPRLQRLVATARAVDREFNYNVGSDLGAGEAGGLRPPHPPAFRGAEALRAFVCSGCSLSHDRTTCPGQIFFPEIRLLLNKPLVRGSFAAWGKTFLQKSDFFKQATCPGQLRCLGQNFWQKIDYLKKMKKKKPLDPGSFAAWGRTFSRKSDFVGTSNLSRSASLPRVDFFLKKNMFFKKPLVPGSFASRGRTFSQKAFF